jgi:hypothetical protein
MELWGLVVVDRWGARVVLGAVVGLVVVIVFLVYSRASGAAVGGFGISSALVGCPVGRGGLLVEAW